ncbi:MAG: 4Fe-4S dicluster domain-containing protein [bacterium]|nr:4Fe-4S dicluster domain-containing protein [bacterium]
MNRREYLKLLNLLLAGGLCGCGGSVENKKKYFRFGYRQTNYLRPPGALPETLFVESCIKCGICAQVCPLEAIRFFPKDIDGQAVAHTPYIIASERACNLCLDCTRVCPTDALVPVEKKENVNMGLAILEENLCFPYIKQGGCGACYTVCPVNAIELDKQRYPKVIDKKCVGCGLCEEVCLQKVKAIRIKKNPGGRLKV